MRILGIEDGKQKAWKSVYDMPDKAFLALSQGRLYTPERYSNVEIGNGDTDDYLPIMQCIEDAPSGSVIYFSKQKYCVSDTIEINKTVKLVGNVTSLADNGNQIFGTDPTKPVLVIRGVNNYISFGGISNLRIGGVDRVDSNFVELDYLLGGSIMDLFVNGNTLKTHVKIKRCQDMAFFRMFLRHTGDAFVDNESLLLFDSPDVVNGDNNCNDLRFIGCHLEHSKHLVKSIYTSGAGRNNTITFTNCKFEGRGNYSINLHKTMGFSFSDCRYTAYDKCFYVKDSMNLSITGKAQYASGIIPEEFGTFENVNGLDINIQGNRAGFAKIKGCTRVIENITDSGEQVKLANKSLKSLEDNSNYLQFFANCMEGSTVEYNTDYYADNVIKGSEAYYATFLQVRPSVVSKHTCGLTFHFKAFTTTSKEIEMRVVDESREIVVKSFNLNDESKWYYGSISPDLLTGKKCRIQLNNKEAGSSAYIEEFYIEEGFVTNSIPSSGYWEKGAKIKYSDISLRYEAICIESGTPGRWKQIEYANDDYIQIDDNCSIQIAEGTSVNGTYSISYIANNRYNIIRLQVSSNQYGEGIITILSNYNFGNNAVFSNFRILSKESNSKRILAVSLSNVNGGGTLVAKAIGPSTEVKLSTTTENEVVDSAVVYLNYSGRFGVGKEPTAGQRMHIGTSLISLMVLMENGNLIIGNTSVDNGEKLQVNGNISLAGKIKMQTGLNKPLDSITLTAGTATKSNSQVTTSSKILAIHRSVSGAKGVLDAQAGNGIFTVNSSSNTDNSTIDVFIFN